MVFEKNYFGEFWLRTASNSSDIAGIVLGQLSIYSRYIFSMALLQSELHFFEYQNLFHKVGKKEVSRTVVGHTHILYVFSLNLIYFLDYPGAPYCKYDRIYFQKENVGLSYITVLIIFVG